MSKSRTKYTINNSLIEKIRGRLWSKIVGTVRYAATYPFLYRSYWHYLMSRGGRREAVTTYLSASPNPGGGIGHQMANWIGGYWFAEKLNLKFAHIPFTIDGWEAFLGFGEQEVKVFDLQQKGYKKRRLPLFDENNLKEVNLIQRIVDSYQGERAILLCEQDQFYKEHYGVQEAIQRKFYSASARRYNKLVFDETNFNIAIHVRRGTDIVADSNDPNIKMRYLANNYYEKVLTQVLERTRTKKQKHIYFFSQGKPEDYVEFERFENLHWCLDMGAKESFLHMVYADLLITSKSSFSYKPALLNKNVKVCPMNFWHSYPDTEDWILADNTGKLNSKQIKV